MQNKYLLQICNSDFISTACRRICFTLIASILVSNIYGKNIIPTDCGPIIKSESSFLATTGPVSLTYATYFGQSINNNFNDIVVDDSGNIYAYGATISQGFDGVLTKWDATGNLIWQELIGGTDADNFNSNDNSVYGKLTLDNAGNIYLTGITESNNFPTLNAFQTTKSGGIDAFVAKYDPAGTLLFSSYLGGAGDENSRGAGGIAVDSNGNIFVAGSTTASGFFNATGSFQNSFSGGTEPDAFIVKISSDFSTVTGS